MVRYLEPPPPPARLSGPVVRGRVFVLAPHPDDETIGPGGTLRLHARSGDEIAVVFLTAGASADPSASVPPEVYAARRQAEARAAAQVLGIGALEFWGLPDNHKVNENDLELLVPRLQDALLRLRPDVVYAPHEADQHSDHHATAVALRRALARLPKPPLAFGYEVWSACLATHVVDTSAVHEEKLAALRCYGSQLEHTDIVRFITGLNAYRAVFLAKGARFGEAFLPLTPHAGAGRR
ncbi:MAG: PIG-L family deacetylase [Planctomycetes bacterium]|nr:PIG-L family deacetylase [Planctomycetota bacterium]